MLSSSRRRHTRYSGVTGDLIFYSGKPNGRYKNICHVAIYAGNGKLIEARNEKWGVVYADCKNKSNITVICRPGKAP